MSFKKPIKVLVFFTDGKFKLYITDFKRDKDTIAFGSDREKKRAKKFDVTDVPEVQTTLEHFKYVTGLEIA